MSDNLISQITQRASVTEARQSIAAKEYPKAEQEKTPPAEPEAQPREREYKSQNPVVNREAKTAEPEGREEKSDSPTPKKEEKEEKEPKKEEKKESEKRKIKYKMDNEEFEEEFSDDEISDAVSGHKAIQKRFTEFDKTKKAFEKEKSEILSKHQAIDAYLGNMKQHFSGIVSEFEKTGKIGENITEPMFDMLDKLGVDAQKFDSALFYHYIPMVAEFLDMDDNQREAFFVKKENDWLRKKQNLVSERERQTQENQKRFAEENSLKRQAGLSEEQFAELQQELAGFGLDEKDLDVQKVVSWAKEKPFYDRSKGIVETVGKGDVFKIARLLMEFPSITDEEVLKSLGYKDKLKANLKEELKDKLPAGKKPNSDKEKRVEEQVKQQFKNYRR